MNRGHLRLLGVAALAGLAFEFAVLSDFDGARASDLHMLQAGGGSSGGYFPPPNVIFIFDTSGSMNNHICEDLYGSAQCDDDTNATRAGPNDSQICYNTVFHALADGNNNPYVAPFASDGSTRNTGAIYPVFDERTSSSDDDTLLPWATYSHQQHNAWNEILEGEGSDTWARIEDAIQDTCSPYDTCDIRSRCIYSLRTQGYFDETGDHCLPSGDPMAQCSDPGFPGPAGGSRVFLGDFMNFYAPKSFALIKAFTDTVENMGADARIGVGDFSDNNTGNISYSIAGNCEEAVTTDCLDVSTSTECFDPDDATLLDYLYNLAFNGSTPLAIALDNGGTYYADSTASETDRPICDYSGLTDLCSDGNVSNYIVLISDGLPNRDARDSSSVPHVASHVRINDGYYHDDGDWVDDVAHALAEIDHRSDLDGNQFVNTYTVSFGLLDASDPTLCHGVMEEAAVAGGGQCFPAASSSQLRDALTQIILQIQKKVHGFAAPATATTRRADSSSLSAAMFRPSTEFPLWEGHVFGLQLCDETLAGDDCDCPVADDSVCVVDANDAAVAYDSEGQMTSTPYWDAQLCLSKDPGNPPPSGLGPDQAGISTSSCYLSPANRNIYTVIDSSGDGQYTIADSKIAFTTANVTNGSDLLAALNTGGNVTDAQEVVNFFRGFDTGDYDADGNNSEARSLATMLDASGELVDGWWVLGDIFHSIPNVVTRPVSGSGGWNDTGSYAAFASDHDDRIKTMLVGANDGMLHAFHAGAWDSDDQVYDNGLGKELWAFVSPALLPVLKDVCDPSVAGGCGIGNHRYLVDGSVMVRDIWIGGTSDKEDADNKTLWKTVAIYGHRRGGTTYVALDVTDVENPVFLWQFPQPGTAEASIVAQSWLDVYPAPASIGPLFVENSGNARYDRWVALLSGGYDPTDATGNGLFVLDAYTGEKIWSATKPSSTSGTDLDEMKYSFPATPVFYSDYLGQMPYIFGIVAADHGGQLWHVPIGANPVDLTHPSLTPEIVFRTVSPTIASDGSGGDNDGDIEADEYQTRPFFFAPTLSRLQGQVRVIIGTGDRDHMVPHGTLSPTDGTRGTKCTSDDDCDTGLACDTASGRCSDCNEDADCDASCVRTDTTCLHSYCDDAACQVLVDTVALEPEVNDMVCNEPGRLYSLNLARCSDNSGGTRPCTESDLQEITVNVTTPSNSVYSNAGSIGWYYVLDPGEKVATPYEIINGFAMYTTFYPTVGCGRGGDICSADSRGEARLYVRHFVTGAPLDWDLDGSIVASEAVVSLGSGVPTAPAVSVAIADGTATPTVMAGASDSGLRATGAGGLSASMATEIIRLPVGKEMHNALH